MISVNGLQQNKTFYALDGIWNENTGNMNQTSVVPNPDSLEEVRVLQNNYSARYSLMGSSVVLLQTKSGTNHFHGTAWEFLRNEALNSKPYFSTSILPYKQNIFGYNIGGPVFIPKVYNTKREKTFFFFSQQFVILHQTPTGTLTGITPTADQRAGRFASPVKNPTTGLLYPQNAAGQWVIPTPDPNALALLNAVYPLPNYSNGSQNYINRKQQITNQRDDEIKIDHNFNQNFHLLAEYLDEYQKYAQNSLAGAQSGEIYETNGETDFTHNKLAQLALSQVLSPNLLNTTSIGMNIFNLDLNLTGAATVDQIPGYAAKLPFNGYISNRIPLLTFSGGLGPEGIPADPPSDATRPDLDNTVADGLELGAWPSLPSDGRVDHLQHQATERFLRNEWAVRLQRRLYSTHCRSGSHCRPGRQHIGMIRSPTCLAAGLPPSRKPATSHVSPSMAPRFRPMWKTASS